MTENHRWTLYIAGACVGAAIALICNFLPPKPVEKADTVSIEEDTTLTFANSLPATTATTAAALVKTDPAYAEIESNLISIAEMRAGDQERIAKLLRHVAHYLRIEGDNSLADEALSVANECDAAAAKLRALAAEWRTNP